jgi:rhomboid protease GluP
MGIKKIIVENWITRKLPEQGNKTTLFLVTLLVVGSALFLNDIYHAGALMPASYETVVNKHQYYRLWTALFAHGDLEHIMSNLFLFIPFAYLLAHYFSLWLFPLIGFLLGGVINFIVVHYLGGNITIIGVSGVVYWMGAAWMSLSFFIDRRESMLARFLKLSGVSLILFFTTTFIP